MADPKIMESMMSATGNMQQFYDKFTANNLTPDFFTKPAPAAPYGAYEPGIDELRWRELHDKIHELEQRLGQLEKGTGRTHAGGGKRVKK